MFRLVGVRDGRCLGASAPLGVPTNLKARRAAAVDRQVDKRPADRHHRPDRPLGQVDQGHRSKRVDLAAEGELASAGDDHHHDIHLVVSMRLDAIAHA